MKRIIALLCIVWGAFTLSGCIQQSDTSLSPDVQTWDQYSLEDIEQRIVATSQTDLESQYKQQNNVKNLYLLIDYLVSDFQYNKAANYFQELMSRTSTWDRSRLLKILINDLQPGPGHYDKLYGFLSGYIISWSINSDDALYYWFTLDLLRNKFDKNNINLLTGNYVDFKNLLRKQFDIYYGYKDAPDYYLKTLFGIAYFKRQDFGVAKALADMAIAENPNYILPYQIKAYVGLLTKQYDVTKQALDVLMQLDVDKLERYQFLWWLMYYNQKDVVQAKNYFLQMKSPTLRIEGLRYLIDLERKDDKAMLRYLDQLFTTTDVWHVWQLKAVDFQTVFDWYIYDRLRVGSGGGIEIKKLYLTHPDILNIALDTCDQVLVWEQFVCQYGKAGKLLLDDKWSEAIKILIPLVKKYPQWQTYYIIWLMYKEQGLEQNARVYFAKALQYIESSEQRKVLSEMMMDLLNKNVDQ